MKILLVIPLIFFTMALIYAKSSSVQEDERLFDMKYIQNVGEDEEIIADNMASFDLSTMNNFLDLPVSSTVSEKQSYIQQSLLKPEGM